MKIIFFGTPEFSLKTLEVLDKHQEVVLVVTQPDKRKGRGKKLQMTPVKEYAAKAGIPVFQPANINDSDSISFIRGFNPDIAVVVAYGQILNSQILDLPKLGCYNIHASLLPYYRGAAPINSAIINGEKKTGVTIMKMDKGMDTGDILLSREIPLNYTDTAELLHDRLSILGSEAILEAIEILENGKVSFSSQNDEIATYAPKISKETGEIDWQMNAEKIRDLIRGLNPWPLAYTYVNGMKMKILEANYVECQNNLPFGTFIEMRDRGFLVKTGDGCLTLKRIQFPNKKAMYSDEYARGHIIEPGTIFGK
ncbi:MAG TPA: methionyl-tRNA formyltransferase [Clostridia bacterium]|nr:methionyl-tRNA formyltransferase [Clostridia bacterium]